MSRSLPHAILWVMIAACIGAASPVQPMPQSEIVFVRMSVDLWPDYDRRGVLVIYRGDLAPGVELPATLSWSMPAAAGTPTAVAERRPDGLVNLSFERIVEGDTAIIETRVTRPGLQLEYYDPRLAADGATRSFTYRWPGDFEVGELTVTVQQPDLATELTTDPAAAGRSPGNDGLLYHTVSLGSLAVGETAAVDFTYRKDDERLTMQTMQQAMTPPQATAAQDESGASDGELLIVTLVLIAAVLAVAAGIVLLRGRGDGGSEARSTDAGRFCTQCGAPGTIVDRFCHRCGEALRPVGKE